MTASRERLTLPLLIAAPAALVFAAAGGACLTAVVGFLVGLAYEFIQIGYWAAGIDAAPGNHVLTLNYVVGGTMFGAVVGAVGGAAGGAVGLAAWPSRPAILGRWNAALQWLLAAGVLALILPGVPPFGLLFIGTFGLIGVLIGAWTGARATGLVMGLSRRKPEVPGDL